MVKLFLPIPCRYTKKWILEQQKYARIAIGYWIAKNKNEFEQTERVESMDKKSGRSIIKHKYTGGPTGCEVWLYEVTDGSHSWFEDDIDTGEEIWSFFSKYLE